MHLLTNTKSIRDIKPTTWGCTSSLSASPLTSYNAVTKLTAQTPKTFNHKQVEKEIIIHWLQFH